MVAFPPVPAANHYCKPCKWPITDLLVHEIKEMM